MGALGPVWGGELLPRWQLAGVLISLPALLSQSCLASSARIQSLNFSWHIYAADIFIHSLYFFMQFCQTHQPPGSGGAGVLGGPARTPSRPTQPRARCQSRGTARVRAGRKGEKMHQR